MAYADMSPQQLVEALIHHGGAIWVQRADEGHVELSMNAPPSVPSDLKQAIRDRKEEIAEYVASHGQQFAPPIVVIPPVELCPSHSRRVH